MEVMFEKEANLVKVGAPAARTRRVQPWTSAKNQISSFGFLKVTVHAPFQVGVKLPFRRMDRWSCRKIGDNGTNRACKPPEPQEEEISQ